MSNNNKNISINNESVNNSKDEFNYYSLNKTIHRELFLNKSRNKIKTDDLYHLMNHLACEFTTYKNGLVGVHSKITQYQLCDELKINRGRFSGYLERLEEMNFIKIFSLSPIIIQILELPKIPKINDIKSLLLYVSANPHDFKFNVNLNRKKEFFDTFKQYEDEIIKSNIDRATPNVNYINNNPEEQDDFDPFA